jgi:hypothetical protein
MCSLLMATFPQSKMPKEAEECLQYVGLLDLDAFMDNIVLSYASLNLQNKG